MMIKHEPIDTLDNAQSAHPGGRLVIIMHSITPSLFQRERERERERERQRGQYFKYFNYCEFLFYIKTFSTSFKVKY